MVFSLIPTPRPVIINPSDKPYTLSIQSHIPGGALEDFLLSGYLSSELHTTKRGANTPKLSLTARATGVQSIQCDKENAHPFYYSEQIYKNPFVYMDLGPQPKMLFTYNKNTFSKGPHSEYQALSSEQSRPLQISCDHPISFHNLGLVPTSHTLQLQPLTQCLSDKNKHQQCFSDSNPITDNDEQILASDSISTDVSPQSNNSGVKNKKKKMIPTRRSQRIQAKRRLNYAPQSSPLKQKARVDKIPFALHSPETSLETEVAISILQESGLQIDQMTHEMILHATKEDLATDIN